MTQNIEERAKINTFRSVSAMIAIGVINIITIPLISKLGNGSDQQGYLLVAILYGIIFALCHIFCFANVLSIQPYIGQTVYSGKKELILLP